MTEKAEPGKIVDFITRARRAQQVHEQKHDVQLEIDPNLPRAYGLMRALDQVCKG
jgi:hypothetical protein